MISCLWSPAKFGDFPHISQVLPLNSASFNDSLFSWRFCCAIFPETRRSGTLANQDTLGGLVLSLERFGGVFLLNQDIRFNGVLRFSGVFFTVLFPYNVLTTAFRTLGIRVRNLANSTKISWL
jgi:hypothetical protein